MSYILEALKKVEQKRERLEAPKEFTFSGKTVTERKKQALWPYLLLAALLLNAGVIVWWVGSWPRGQQAFPAEVPAVHQPVSVEPAESEDRLQGRSTDGKEVPQVKGVSKLPAPVAEKEVRDVSLPTVGKRAVTDRKTTEPEAPKEKGPPARERVFALNELPPNIKGALPEFKVSGHAYSPEPRTRVVRINDKILQEGQELAPGLKVEEIIPDGIVFSYEGYHFRIETNGSR